MSMRVDLPQPGFYKRRLIKGGPFIGVMVWQSCPFHWQDGEMTVDRSRPLLCLVNGEHANAHDQWSWVAGSRVTEAEYRFLMADAAHASEYRPTAPRARPREKIDMLTVELPY